MMLAYLALVVASGAVAAVRPSCTIALVVWYSSLIGGGFVEYWWPLAGLASHIVAAPWLVALARSALPRD